MPSFGQLVWRQNDPKNHAALFAIVFDAAVGFLASWATLFDRVFGSGCSYEHSYWLLRDDGTIVAYVIQPITVDHSSGPRIGQ